MSQLLSQFTNGAFVPETNLRVLRVLGVGSQGSVILAQDSLTNRYYAVKCVSKTPGMGPQHEDDHAVRIRREAILHSKVGDHSNIVTLLETVETDDCLFLVMSYEPDGDLFSHIVHYRAFADRADLARSVFLQIVDAVAHCHSQGVYHRDLKPENVLVSEGGASVKLADFGLATDSRLNLDNSCGTAFTMAPELCCPCPDQHQGPCPFPDFGCDAAAADVWALGVILINLLTGRNPWRKASLNDPHYSAFRADPFALKRSFKLSSFVYLLLLDIFHPDPTMRPSAADLRSRIVACDSLVEPPSSHVPAAAFARRRGSACIPFPSSPSVVTSEGSLDSHADPWAAGGFGRLAAV